MKRSANAERDRPDLVAKLVDGPTPGDVAVHQGQRPRNVRLAQTGEPSRLALREGLRVSPHCFHEQQLRKLGEHGLRPWAAGRDLLRGVLKCRADPFRGPTLLDVELEHGWQGRDHWIALGAVATEEPADHPGAF